METSGYTKIIPDYTFSYRTFAKNNVILSQPIKNKVLEIRYSYKHLKFSAIVHSYISIMLRKPKSECAPTSPASVLKQAQVRKQLTMETTVLTIIETICQQFWDKEPWKATFWIDLTNRLNVVKYGLPDDYDQLVFLLRTHVVKAWSTLNVPQDGSFEKFRPFLSTLPSTMLQTSFPAETLNHMTDYLNNLFEGHEVSKEISALLPPTMTTSMSSMTAAGKLQV